MCEIKIAVYKFAGQVSTLSLFIWLLHYIVL